MDEHEGRRLIRIAAQYVGCHYINGGYGASPDGKLKGSPHRPGGVDLVADRTRLDPRIMDPSRSLAVKAARTAVKGAVCICAGRVRTFPGGRPARPDDQDLKDYLASLGPDPRRWPNAYEFYTPRRSFGPGEAGELFWAEECTSIRHFDCIGFVNYCMWELTGVPYSFEIAQWIAPSVSGAKVIPLEGSTATPQDGDILVRKPGHPDHIAIVAADGTIYQAAQTKTGVTSTDRFSRGNWTHIVRFTPNHAKPPTGDDPSLDYLRYHHIEISLG